MGNEAYTKILSRYLFVDIIMIAILILVSFLVIILLFILLPNEKKLKKQCDWNNQTARRVMCIAISIICIFAVVITSKEVLDITCDLENETFIYCTGSYRATRNEMVVITENGNIIKLKYLHSVLDNFEAEYAEIWYSERSHILLSCKVE